MLTAVEMDATLRSALEARIRTSRADAPPMRRMLRQFCLRGVVKGQDQTGVTA